MEFVKDEAVDMIRCQNRECRKALGEREGARLSIRRIGLVLRGGVHSWDCQHCGLRNLIDLEEPVDRTAPIAAQSS